MKNSEQKVVNCVTGEGCRKMTYKEKKQFRRQFSPSTYKQIYPRKQQQYYIKKINEDLYKIVWLRSVKESFVSRETLEEEAIRRDAEWFDKEIEKIFPTKKEKESDGKMKESVSRTKRVIWEYAMCNRWDYFVTLTLDPKKVDRQNLKAVYSKFHDMMAHINSSVTGEDWGRQKKIEYMIIPEFHKDGSVHFHGLMRGFHKTDLRINEHGHMEWRHWRDNFGFCNMQEIKDANAVSAYITKYCTKDLRATIKEKGAHMFYASHGLKKPELIYHGGGVWCGLWDYVSDDGYCATSIVTRKELANFIGEWGDVLV